MSDMDKKLSFRISPVTETGTAIDEESGQIAVIPARAYVDRVTIALDEQFGAQLDSFELGKAGDPDWLVANDEHGLRSTAPNLMTIVNNPVVVADTALVITISQAGNATGSATVTVWYRIL